MIYEGGIIIKRLIIFLIRRKLGLKKNEHFRFVGQKSTLDTYYFTNDMLMKVDHHEHKHGFQLNSRRPANVSLKWLLDDECKIIKVVNP